MKGPFAEFSPLNEDKVKKLAKKSSPPGSRGVDTSSFKDEMDAKKFNPPGPRPIDFLYSARSVLQKIIAPLLPILLQAGFRVLLLPPDEENIAVSIWPWVKIQIVPPVNIPIATKRGSKMGGELYPTWDPNTVLTHSQIDQNGWCT